QELLEDGQPGRGVPREQERDARVQGHGAVDQLHHREERLLARAEEGQVKAFILSVNYPLGAGIIKTASGRKYCFLMKDLSMEYPPEIYPPRNDDDVEFERGAEGR